MMANMTRLSTCSVTTPTMNLALAQLLKGDITKAKTTMDAVKPCKCGAPSYLKAVIAARQDNKDGVLNGLREAIGYNSDWKNYAHDRPRVCEVLH